MPMNKEELQKKSSRGTVLLAAEGDSWFEFPLRSHILRELGRLGYAVREVADHSHTLEFMATSPHQQAEFSEMINRLGSRKTKPTAILLSGGGNDFVDYLPSLLNRYDPRGPILNASEVDDFAVNHLRKNYVKWLNFITKTCDDSFQDGRRIPILIHGYAYAVPDGRGIPFYGHWLRKEFRAKGHRSLAQNTQTMATLVDKFNDVLSGLPGEKDFNHVHYVNLRNTLSNDLGKENGKRKYKEDWGDELHPTNEGFAKVAAEFARVIDAL